MMDAGQLGEDAPQRVIPDLCQQFYQLGWFTATGGSISMRDGDNIYVSPSGIPKEKVKPEDIFVQTLDGAQISGPPASKNLRQSTCTPNFLHVYRLRNAGAVIHSHSPSSVLAGMLCPGTEFTISHQQLIKVFRHGVTGVNLRNDDTLVIPIVENALNEDDIAVLLGQALADHPEAPALLIRRHGFYVWGDTWQRAKNAAEALDYLASIFVEMTKLGLDPKAPPKYPDGAYLAEYYKPEKYSRNLMSK